MMQGPSAVLRNSFAKLITEAVKKEYSKLEIGDADVLLSIATSAEGQGDITSSICFRISKLSKESPAAAAQKLAPQIKEGIITECKAAGGYLNATVDAKAYSKQVIEAVLKQGDEYCRSDAGEKAKVIVEYPSVNPNKPWHVGHLRNALLGDSVSNIMEACSYAVEREDYIDDLGIQMAESLWGYLNIPGNADKKFDTWLGEQYVEVNKRMKEGDITNEINFLQKDMEMGDTANAKTARELAERCVSAQNQTAWSYRICHDVMIWESDIMRAKLLERSMKILEEKGAVHKETEGKYKDCVVVDLEKLKGVAKDFENPSEEAKVLIRSNGTATYVAKDIAFHMWKFGMLDDDFKYSVFEEKQGNGKPLYTTGREGKQMNFGKVKMAVNVIGSAQRYPQLIMRSTFLLLDMKEISQNIMHLSYGEVGVEGGTLSGRKGGWMGEGNSYTADHLLEEARKKVMEKVETSKKLKDGNDKETIATAVALGAIKFEFLRIAPERKVTFSWTRALSFEGNSGPYCMYTYARAMRIMEKERFEKSSDQDFEMITHGIDFELVKLLGCAGETVEKACAELRPNVISDYLIGLCTIFSRFYEKMPVIKGGDAKNARLALVKCTSVVLKDMLRLMGIEAVESM